MAATSGVQCKISATARLGTIREFAVVPVQQPPSLKLTGGVCLKPVAEYRHHLRFPLRDAQDWFALNKISPSGRFTRLPNQNAQIPKPPVGRIEHGLNVIGVLWPAGKPQRFTLTAVPKGTRFLVKESRANGAGGGIVPTDVIEHGGVLDVFRERDGMFAPLPLQNDIFGELHDTRRVSPLKDSLKRMAFAKAAKLVNFRANG